MTLENTNFTPVEVAERRPSPLSPSQLVDLYFRPKKYFSNTHDLDHQSALFISAGLMGIAGAMGRIDKKIIQAELGHASKGWESTASWLLSSWLNYWLVVVAAGLIGAVFLWYIGGWWYKVRLNWSGAVEPSSILARRVYTLQELVLAGPTVLLTLIQTALFSNYLEAWRADEFWSSSILLFAFWSCWTSYVAVTTTFQVSKLKARIWFLVLPILLYVVVLGVIGTLYSIFGGNTV
ncbi:MAG: hypothetical protein B7X95_00660 [Methylophilaceae bacterium 17-44-8]|jgi:hypothetical protein|nr:MAG: hypothetical protein B7Y48_04085 [Methylophilales bacterium 28-44-11]OZA06949.1 MAG: hypothetical protein B7X95_00660 [Methylophilaceae bacterium 17-44-8]